MAPPPEQPVRAAEPLQGPQVPAGCGAAHRLRPDIAAALLWGPHDKWALTAERLIEQISDTELVLVITAAWLSPQGWGLFAVTTDRALYVPNAASENSFEQPIASMLWLNDPDKSDDLGNQKANLVDFERDIALWFDTRTSITEVNVAIRRAVRIHTNTQPGYEPAHTDDVMEDFSRFSALHRAHQTGALDDDAMRAAVSRLFGQPFPPPEQ